MIYRTTNSLLLVLCLINLNSFGQSWTLKQFGTVAYSTTNCNGHLGFELTGLGNVEFTSGFPSYAPFGLALQATHSPNQVIIEDLCLTQNFAEMQGSVYLNRLIINTPYCMPFDIGLRPLDYQSDSTVHRCGYYLTNNTGSNVVLTVSATNPSSMQANDGSFTISGISTGTLNAEVYRGTREEALTGTGDFLGYGLEHTGLSADYYYIELESPSGIYERAIELEVPLFPADPTVCDIPRFHNIITYQTTPGNCDGAVYFDVINGTPPYSFEVSTGDTLQYAENLCPGLYSVDVTDANGVVVSNEFIISDPSNIVGYQDPIPYSVYDTLYTDIYEDCNIDYTLPIDSAVITHIELNDSAGYFLTAYWTIYQSQNEFYVTETYEADQIGPSMFTLTVYCLEGRSTLGSYQLFDFVELNESELLDLPQHEKADSPIRVYPNPSDVFTIHSSVLRPLRLTVQNLQGKTVLTDVISTRKHSLDLSAKPAGIYLLRIGSENVTWQSKIVKQ